MILGPTGAGKTILLESIAGIYYPDKGRIWMDGKDITNTPPRQRNISINGINVKSTTCKSGDCVVSLRPEDILVSKNSICLIRRGD